MGVVPGQVIMVSTFSDGGVEQVNFDLRNYLIPMLAGYCDDIQGKQLFER